MSQRLRPRDLAFLAEESPTTPMHNATVEIFEPGDSGFDYERLVELIGDRISFVPRYRQRLQLVPGRLANPVWVDDARFDLGYHVRRSALPRPGSHDQLRELVARIVSRPLDRSRPLWECYFVEGLADGRVAVLSKVAPDPRRRRRDRRPRPGAARHVAGPRDPRPTTAGARDVRRPSSAAWRRRGQGLLESPRTLWSTPCAQRRVAVPRGLGRRPPGRRGRQRAAERGPVHASPVEGPLSQQRRFVAVRTDLAAYRKIRQAHGGTVNDVILATVAGACAAG